MTVVDVNIGDFIVPKTNLEKQLDRGKKYKIVGKVMSGNHINFTVIYNNKLVNRWFNVNYNLEDFNDTYEFIFLKDERRKKLESILL